MHLELADAALPIRPAVVNRGVPAGRGSAAALGRVHSYASDEEIFAEGDQPRFFYKVLSGAVRVVTLLSDGRRHIGAFHLPGDIFGIELGDAHRFSAEAIGRTTVVCYPRACLGSGDAANAGLPGEVIAAVVRSLERAQNHMLLLGRKSAIEKVASFLLDMSQRLGSETVLRLPMSRADIADHLGLTIETVSRSLTQLERQGIIELPAHRRSFVLRDKACLQHLAGRNCDAASAKGH
jgi:CRP/FNR family nitrogen fixation transcriptional regulator